MTFVVYLILINFFLFLPRYLLGLPNSWNPFAFLFSDKPLRNKIRNVYFSRIIDPLRLSTEYSLLAIAIFSSGIVNFWTLGILSFVGLLVFCFNIYIAVFTIFLYKTPVIKSDWLFLKDCVAFYKGYFLIIIVGTILLLAGLSYIFSLFSQFLSTLPVNIFHNIGLVLLILLFGFRKTIVHAADRYMYRTVFSVIMYIKKSEEYSIQYDHLLNISESEIENYNHFKNVSLRKKPNIHIISMESYGSIIFKQPEKYGHIKESLENWNKKFKNAGIKIRTSFSIPPLFAIGTWYSYSTLLFGMLIKNAIKHNILFKDMTNFSAYESLFQFTRREGYTNYVLHGLIGNFDKTLDYEKFKRNISYDVLLHNEDLNYEGQLLDFMRMQKAAPDQFTLNKGLDLLKGNENPYTFFYCTLNAHWDFCSPIDMADNWEDLNDETYKFKTTIDGNLNPNEKFSLSMDYTINSVFDAIINHMKDDDIYIVYGDHQPTTLTDEKYGSDTQMHILSKNEAFLKEWEKHGFNKGMIPEEHENYIKFEAFYSILISCLNKVYGEDTNLDVPIFKNGIRFD